MPTTLTLKNIPDELHRGLRASADAHRRSLSSEAIVWLESVLAARKPAATEHLARIRALREQVGGRKVSAREIDRWKRQGRP